VVLKAAGKSSVLRCHRNELNEPDESVTSQTILH